MGDEAYCRSLSGEYVARLKRRALSFLKEAEEAADADLAVFAKQAMQLYLKAVFYEKRGLGVIA